MKLLMTADAVGGVWQYATELAQALAPHGVETTIAVLGPGPSAEQLAAISSPPCKGGVGGGCEAEPSSTLLPSDRAGDGAPAPTPSPSLEGRGAVRLVHTDLPLDWLAPGPEPVLAAAHAIRELAREIGADVIHLNSPALAAGGPCPAPVVAVAHGCVATWWEAAHGTALPDSFAWHEALMRDGLNAADAVIAPSRAYAGIVARRYRLARSPQAVHNGRTPLPLGDAPAARWAFTAGRLWDRVKNTALLDRVAARVPIRAAGPVTAPQGETVAPAHLTLLGSLDSAALARELSARPVFVSAASFEPFGLAVLEAAQASCPLVLADIATFRELWSDAAIFARDEDEYVAAIATLLADPAEHRAWGERARRRAATYTPAATAAAMAAIYAGLLPARRAAA